MKDADDFHTFAQAEGADKIIVRPEFVKISKLDEVEKFKTSVSREWLNGFLSGEIIWNFR